MKVKHQRKSLIHFGAVSMIVGGLALTACNEETASTGGDNSALQERLVKAEEQHTALKKELEQLKADARAKKKSAEAERKTHEEALVKLQKELRNVKKKNEELKTEYDSYREEYKVSVRKNAKGVELGEVKLSTGQTYTGVIVSKWTPAALRVTHSGGNATIPFEELPQGIQTVFLYDKEETKELLAKGEEAVSTGKPYRRPTRVASSGPWPTKDPNGKPRQTVFTEPEHTGIVNAPAALTRLDVSIRKYDALIRKNEDETNRLDKRVSEAIGRGSSIKSLERKLIKLTEGNQKLRAERAKLIERRERINAAKRR